MTAVIHCILDSIFVPKGKGRSNRGKCVLKARVGQIEGKCVQKVRVAEKIIFHKFSKK